MSFSVFCVTVRIISLLLATSGKSDSKSKNKNVKPKKKTVSAPQRALVHKDSLLRKMKIKAVFQVYTTSEEYKECSFDGGAETATPTALKVKLHCTHPCSTTNMVFKSIIIRSLMTIGQSAEEKWLGSTQPQIRHLYHTSSQNWRTGVDHYLLETRTFCAHELTAAVQKTCTRWRQLTSSMKLREASKSPTLTEELWNRGWPLGEGESVFFKGVLIISWSCSPEWPPPRCTWAALNGFHGLFLQKRKIWSWGGNSPGRWWYILQKGEKWK